MSDLQLMLLGVGALIVAGVYAFNKWQERQFHKRVEAAFAHEHDDVLLDESAALPTQSAADEDTVDERVEPRFTQQDAIAEAATVAPVAAVVNAHDTTDADEVDDLDYGIDYVVETTFPTAVDRVADIYQAVSVLASGWSKPVQVSSKGAAGDAWQSGADAYARPTQVRFALQLSSRRGCVTAGQLAEFLAAVSRWCEHNGGTVKSQDLGEAHAMAEQIDHFCAEVDVAIGINVVTSDGKPFTGTKIRSLAEAAGLRLNSNGVFHAPGDGLAAGYALDNHEPMPFVPEQIKTLTTSGVTFLLDVPRVGKTLQAFDQMLESARSFAVSLGGTLVDDNRSVLSDAAIAKIRLQLEGLIEKMNVAHVPPGSARALRLFS